MRNSGIGNRKILLCRRIGIPIRLHFTLLIALVLMTWTTAMVLLWFYDSMLLDCRCHNWRNTIRISAFARAWAFNSAKSYRNTRL